MTHPDASAPRPARRRDVEASREAVLDAAEELFAGNGFHATSVQQIADRAGISRGMPNYLFGSKEQLYRAVLDRFQDTPREVVRRARSAAAEHGSDDATALRSAMDGFFGFLLERPNFVRLMQWESVYGGRIARGQAGVIDNLREALAAMGEGFGFGRLDDGEAAQFLISAVALLWFPLAHATTFVGPLGFDASDPAFLAERRRHAVTVLADALRAAAARRE
jgi:AcrR family transcriptional regulator